MKYEFYRGDPKLMNYQHLLKYDMHDAHPLKKTRFIVSPLKRNGMVRTAVPCATQPAMLTSTVLSLLVHTYMYMYSTVQYSTIHVLYMYAVWTSRVAQNMRFALTYKLRHGAECSSCE